MNVLVTGATGLIGRHLVEALAQRSKVWAVSRESHAFSQGVNCVQWNFRDAVPPATMPRAVDAVFHLAQSPAYRDFPERADDVFDVNVASTARLLDWSRSVGVTRFVLASSGGVDGGRGFYEASKRSAELLCESYRDIFAVIVVRFFFVYGRGQRASMLIPRLVNCVRHDLPIRLDGRDGMRLNPVHVSDAVAALERTTALSEGRTLDVTGPEVLTMREIGEMIGSLVGRRPVFVTGEAAPRDVVGDISQMSALLRAPLVPFATGIGELCDDRTDRRL